MRYQRMKHKWPARVAAMITAAMATVSWRIVGLASAQPLPIVPTTSDATLTVMAVGGSSAHGWADPTNDSYLRRAFTDLADSSGQRLVYWDHTIPGAPAVSISSDKFASWLAADHPQIVAISWGLLDDAHAHTPVAEFVSTLKDEIMQSLNAHAVVLVVTPPSVAASVGALQAPYDTYASAEYDLVASLNNPDVYWMDIHQQTLNYIQGHNDAITQFCTGGWHPNAAGHILAGHLLYEDFRQTFGSHPITFISQEQWRQQWMHPHRAERRQGWVHGTVGHRQP